MKFKIVDINDYNKSQKNFNNVKEISEKEFFDEFKKIGLPVVIMNMEKFKDKTIK